jgi:hypothetical protein
VLAWVAAMPRERVALGAGTEWSLRFAQGSCTEGATADRPDPTRATRPAP